MSGKQWSSLLDSDHQYEAFQFARSIVGRATEPRAAHRIVLVLGNGGLVDLRFRRRDRLIQRYRDRALRLGYPQPISPNERALVWRYNEILRDFSANRMPRPALIYLFHLIQEGLCSLVITPNYDCFLQSMCEKLDVEYALNPTNDQNPRFHDGYGADATGKRAMVLWKYHGDVGHVIFQHCKDVFKLPNFAVLPFSPLSDKMMRIFESPTGGEALAETGQLHYFEGESHSSGWPDHYIDFNFPEIPRSTIFSHEIEGSIQAIDNLNKETTAGFLIIGFVGRWMDEKDRMSEEIVPALLQKVKEGIPATMIFSPRERDIKVSGLAAGLYEIDRRQLWLGEVRDRLLTLFYSFSRLKPALSLDLAWKSEGIFA